MSVAWRRHRAAADPESRIRRSFGLLALLGAVLVVTGIVGLVYVWVATLTSVLLFGWLLLIGGCIGLLHAVQSRKSSFFWLALVVAALNIAAGVVVIRHPVTTAVGLTMFVALLFLAGGVFRLVGGIVVRGPQVGWTVAQGAFGILLGCLVLANWPESTLYTLGAFLSLMLLFDGLSLLAMGMSGRRIIDMVQEQREREAGVPVPPEAAGPAASGDSGVRPTGESEPGRHQPGIET